MKGLKVNQRNKSIFRRVKISLMKKKFSSMGRVAIALVLALSLSLVMGGPVSAQEAGTIELDADWYGTGTVTGEAVGTGDGATTVFSLDNIAVVAASEKIYLAGVLQADPADYGLTDATGVIIFVAAPAADVAITADYTYVTTSDTVTITVEDADLNVPKAYTDEVSDDPDESIKLFTVANKPMSPWPANPVTVMDMAGTSYSVASVNAEVGDVTLLLAPPDDAELMAAKAIALDLDLDAQPYKPTTLTATLDAVPGGTETATVDITGVIVITGESVGSLDGSGDQTGELLDKTPIVAGTVTMSDTANTYTDDGEGVLTGAPAGTGTINYTTGVVTITGGEPNAALTADYDYTGAAVQLTYGAAEATKTTAEEFRSVATDGVDAWTDGLSATVEITATNVVYVTYTGAQENEATVNIKSGSDSSGIDVTLTETGVDTGIFEGTVTLVAAESDEETSELQAAHGDTVTATYTDEEPAVTQTAVATVDDVPPAISNESPADGSFIDDSTPLFSVDVTDPDAGITYGDWTMNIDAPGLGDVTAELSVSPITDGYRLEYLVSSGDDLDEGTYVWTVDVNDNLLVGTHRILEFEFTYDETPPELDAAVTGLTWDAVGEAAEDTNSQTTIMATFSEPLDEATVEASDFLVADLVTPSAIEVQDNLVFLTITEMATDATPSVELVGEVSDIAGNAQTEGLIEAAEDDIDPILTVAADPLLGMDATEITISVTSSEALDALPTVEVTEANGDVAAVTMADTDTTTWEGTYTLDDANTAGVYAVTALGTDLAANDALGVTTISDEGVGTGDATEVTFSTTLANTPVVAGTVIVTDATETFTDGGDGTLTGGAGGSGTINYNTGALSVTFNTAPAAAQDVTAGYDYFAGASANFEGDFATPTVTIIPTDGSEVPTTSLWINLQFDEDVEVLEATFDEVDVLAELYAVGVGQYMLARTSLEMGEHTITVLAADLAGNEMAAPESATFTVVVPPPATIELFPGWNLISLPLIPDDSSIEAVLGEATVDIVWGYDPVNSPDDPWARYVPGLIEDDLTEMVDGMGYWIYMTSPATLTVPGVEMPEPPALPPTYDVVSGWNLIGFKSIQDIDNDVYLANIDYTVLWGYETIGGYFSVHPMNEHPGVPEINVGDMEVAHGYWLWATIEGTIVLPQ